MDANILALFDSSVQQFSTQVAAIGADDWDKPTPDTEWTVTDLVEHLVDEHRWMPPLIGGHDLETAQKMVEAQQASSSGDHAADWQTASIASLQAMGEPGALERTVSLSRGPTPADQYVVEMMFDAAVHAWDLGT
ncbi:MAG TPA: TIGR03086 family metal-binding protein, partial [Jatrophihabitantaceae bacterium]|nr:TIGR03086 family metal-binding protein [Jatrophihabitantaceae bacterium]